MTKETAVKEEKNVKAEKLAAFLTENQINCFEKQDFNDEKGTAVFRSRMEVKGQTLPFAVLLDKTIFSLVQVQLAGSVAKGDALEKLVGYVNELNNNYRFFKFSATAAGDLLLNVVLTAKDEDFDPALLNAVIGETLKFLENEYANIMEHVWRESK